MSDASPLDEPLLSGDQTLWVVVALAWFALGSVALATGPQWFGVGALLLGVSSAYRVFNPG
jgi:hypothetical protein